MFAVTCCLNKTFGGDKKKEKKELENQKKRC